MTTIFINFLFPCSRPAFVPESDVDQQPGGKHIIVGLGSVESSFIAANVPCMKTTNHPDYAPLMLFLQYLTQLEVSSYV